MSVLESLRKEALDAAKKGRFPGVSDFSSMVELALYRLLHPENDLVEAPEVVAK